MTREPAAEPEPRRWHESSFFLLLLIACTLMTLVQFARCMQEGRCMLAEDFEVFYHPAQAMASGDQSSPYPLEKAQAWLASNGANGAFHYSLYPPYSLLLFYPLGLFAPGAALMIWYGMQILALLGACRTSYVKQILSPEGRHNRALAVAMLLPFVVMNLLAGQVGMLCAALFILVLAWRRTRPWAAAFALALLTLKPQLALALPLLLIFEKNFKVLLAAALFALLLVGASFLIFGVPVWSDYVQMLALSPKILSLSPPQLLNVSLSPAMALRMLGIPAVTCLYLQTGVTLIVLALLVQGLLKADEEGKLLLTITATFLLSPYSFHYDAVLLGFAGLVLLKFWREGRITALQRIILIVLAFIPIVAIKLQVMHIPYGFLAILSGFMMAQARPAVRS